MKDKTDAELIEEAESVALVRFVWSDDERRARVLAHELASRLKAANERRLTDYDAGYRAGYFGADSEDCSSADVERSFKKHLERGSKP